MKQEEYTQKALCAYLNTNYPDVVFTSDMSGVRLHQGLRKKVQGLKSERGIPDLIILQPAGGWHGLLLEIKAEDARPLYKKTGGMRKNEHTQEQAEVLLHLRKLGYAAFFVRGIDAGRDIIYNYMAGRLLAEHNTVTTADVDDCMLEYRRSPSVAKIAIK